MQRTWTFGKKIGAGFTLAFVLLAVIGAIAHRSISSLSTTSDSVAHTYEILGRLARLLSALKDAETGQRGFLLVGDDTYLAPYEAALRDIPRTIDDLRALTADNADQQRRLVEVGPLVDAKLAELARTVELRRDGAVDEALVIVRTDEGKRLMDGIRGVAAAIEQDERELLRLRAADVASAVNTGTTAIALGTLLCLLLVTAVGTSLTRSLTGQIGAAVQHIQSSAAELQTVSNQQATGMKEQSTAMTEVSTTISELLATSRQIAENAQRVSHIADDTAKGARVGDLTVARASDAIHGIKRQVDLIVAHMLDLGKKSQQIGGILEITKELAEQTNILAINATIEAVGAGEAGKRFAVVADEIRKLADRVGGSTKEIRGLIEEIRGAVNTTVMTTEGGTKAVDVGTRQFAEVTAAFKQILGQVGTTTEAAREIELSTKQQSTAVEQVKVAVLSVAQTTKQSEEGASQTYQTATELTTLSRELLRLVQPQAGA